MTPLDRNGFVAPPSLWLLPLLRPPSSWLPEFLDADRSIELVFTVFIDGFWVACETDPPAAGADTPSLAVPSDISDAADGSLLPSAPAAPVKASPWTLSALEM